MTPKLLWIKRLTEHCWNLTLTVFILYLNFNFAKKIYFWHKIVFIQNIMNIWVCRKYIQLSNARTEIYDYLNAIINYQIGQCLEIIIYLSFFFWIINICWIGMHYRSEISISISLNYPQGKHQVLRHASNRILMKNSPNFYTHQLQTSTNPADLQWAIYLSWGK